MVRGSCARIMEPASELRANEVRRNSALKKKERSVRVRALSIRVVPPESFGPFTGI